MQTDKFQSLEWLMLTPGMFQFVQKAFRETFHK